MELNKPILVISLLAAITSSAVLGFHSRASLNSPKHKQQDDFSTYPIADADALDPKDAKEILKRRAKNKKYREYRNHIGPGVRAYEIYHWPPGFPTLPVAQSDAVIVGEVTDASAHLTEDRSSVYSEFIVCIEEVLKNDQPALAVGQSVTLDRPGGRVRYSNGKTSQFSLDGFGMPLVGGRYVFFIKGDAQEDYQIITAYQIQQGRIYPLDKTTSSDTRFEIHANANEQLFLTKLRQLSQTLSDPVVR